MVAEVARSLSGLGFSADVLCGAAARASLLGPDDEADEPTIYVVCVQGQLRDRVVGPLRRALAQRDRPNQHLFVAVLDLAMPLAMVGQIRRFAETLESPFSAPDEAEATGAERRQWREHFGARQLSTVPTRDYRPVQLVDRTAPAVAPSGSEAAAPPPPRKRKVFTSTARVVRVGSTGKYKAIAAGRVAELEAPAPPVVEEAAATSGTNTARYRINEMLDTGSHATIDSFDEATPIDDDDKIPLPPRIGLAALLADGPRPAPADGTFEIEGSVLLDAPEGEEDSAAASSSRRAMAKLALRRIPTGSFPAIVEKPTRKSAIGDRNVAPSSRTSSGVHKRRHDPNAALPAVPRDLASDDDTESDADLLATSSSDAAIVPVDADDSSTSANRGVVAAGATHDRAPSRAWMIGLAAVGIAGVGWFALRGPTATDTTAKQRSDAPAVRGAAAATAEPDARRPTALAQGRDDASGPTPEGDESSPMPALDDDELAPPPNGTGDAADTVATSGAAPAALAGSDDDAERELDADTDGEVVEASAGDTVADDSTADDPTADDPAQATPPPVPAVEASPEPPTPAPEAVTELDPGSDAARLAKAHAEHRIQHFKGLYATRPRGGAMSWASAVARCRRLTIDGVGGWVLPWRRQLTQVVVVSGMKKGTWWSRSQVDGDTDMVYALDARTRDLGEYMKSEVTGEVLCVRPDDK